MHIFKLMKSLADTSAFYQPELESAAEMCSLMVCVPGPSLLASVFFFFVPFVFQMIMHHKGTSRSHRECLISVSVLTSVVKLACGAGL